MQDVLNKLDRIAEALTAPQREYLDIDAAADFVGVSRQTIDLWRMERRGPAFVRVGKRCVMYAVKDLRAFMDAHRVEPLD